jgi:hypothetical protein
MKQSQFEIDPRTGRVSLAVKVDTGVDFARRNAQLRNELGKGFTNSRSMRAVADIPFEFIQACTLAGDKNAAILFNLDASPMDKRRALRRFLYTYPEFKISTGAV